MLWMALIPLFVLAVAMAALPVLLMSVHEDRKVRGEGVKVGYLDAGRGRPARLAATTAHRSAA